MIQRSILLILIFSLFLFSSRAAKTLDPYKVLGVDRNASQRDIQKAFHRLSLQYHPDKNKNKGAQEKFAEINNAYEILSDEEKKKNYDLYGDEKGNPGFDGRNFGNGDGYTYFTTGSPGGAHFSSGPGGWQTMGGQGNTRSFSFSFGGDGSSNGSPFGFDFGDMFSNLFSGGMRGGKQHSGFSSGNQFGGFTSSGGSKSGFAPNGIIEEIDSEFFNKNIRDMGLTWLLLFYTPNAEGYHVLQSLSEDVANSLQGALKAGKINCMNQKTLCRELGVLPLKYAKLFIYSFRSGDSGSLVEYAGESDARALKNFCQDYLPRFSKRVDLHGFDFSSSSKENLPQVVLLSTKKDTPIMWRALSGLYHKKIVFYDAEVHDTSHPMLKRLGVEAFPAVAGKMVNGEVHVLKAGIAVKDLKSGINDLRALLETFEKKNGKVASSQAKMASQKDRQGKSIPYLSTSNTDSVCGDYTAVCIIGIFRSSKAREKLEAILLEVSQKSLVRRQNQASGSGDSVSYALLDATKQPAFLYSFDKAGFKSLDKLLVAYKPRKGKFAVYTDKVTMEEVEKFVSSVLSGDVRFSNVRQKPVLK